MAKDFTKYIFSQKKYGKNQLVKAVVEDYINTHKNISLAELEKAFPQEIQHKTGTNFLFDVIREEKYVFEDKRYFSDTIILSDGKVIKICNQWDKDNIPKFIECAKSLGYFISPVVGD